MPKPVGRSAILFGLVFLTQIAVTALDASGNESGSSEISVTTTAAPVVVPPTSSGGGGSAGIWLLLLCLAFVTNHNPFHLFRPGTKDASISTAVFGGVHGVVRESQEPFGAIS